MSRTLILGAGFGGITVATELRRLLGDDHEVVLIDERDEFSMGLRKLWELVGIGTIAEGTRSRRLLADGGIDFRQASVRAIEPAARAVRSDGGAWQGDFLVVALGAEPRPDLVAGLAEHALDVWEPARVPAAKAALEDFDGGRVAVVIAGAPYPCPPAPYECVLLLDEWLGERGLRDRTELVVSTFQPMLLPNAGREASRSDGSSMRTGSSKPICCSASLRTAPPKWSPRPVSRARAAGSVSSRARSRPGDQASSPLVT
jgi:sulfide:quinone oxidoreductase